MTFGGWVTMSLSLFIVWFGTFWCFWRVLKSPQEEQAPSGFGP